MPSIQGVTNIPANGSIANALTGSAYEFLGMDCRVDIAVVGDAAGAARATVQSGSDVLMEESSISRLARIPLTPDDFSLTDVASAGERLKIQLRNTSAGAIDVFWAVKITPL